MKVRDVGRFVVGAAVMAGELEGALHLGVREGARRLRHVGVVLWGLRGEKRRELLEAAQPLTRKTSPFTRELGGDVVHLQSRLEVAVQHFGWLAGRLRDPVYQHPVAFAPSGG